MKIRYLQFARFKIQHDGYNNGVWGTSTVINNQGKQPIKIPDCLPDGQYLLRAEMIALHGASSNQGAQFYVRDNSLLILQQLELTANLDGMRANQHFRRFSDQDTHDLQLPRHV